LNDEELLERLMKEYGDSLLRTCYLYLKDYHLAEDAVQETFLKAVHSYGNLKKQSSEKSWLVRIAINNCKNLMRTAWFRFNRRGLPNEEIAVSDKNFDYLLEHSALVGAVSLLSRADREVILLYYYQGLTVKEVARIINKSENTTAQRLKRARARLKKQLLEAGYDEL
jgi:RNA polymerase sigma factor (sigma-70 family)